MDPLLSSTEPPADVEIEMALLGAMLVQPKAYLQASAHLTGAESFADAAHQKIYAAIERVVLSGGRPSATLLRREFEQEETLADLGRGSYLVELAAGAANIIDATDYARMVEDLAMRRRLVDIGQDIVYEAMRADPDVTGEELANTLIAQMSAALRGASRSKDTISLGEAVDDVMADIRRVKEGGEPPGTTTGLRSLDDEMGRMQPEELIVAGGPTGAGKSALALSIALHVAEVHGRVYFGAFEMSSKQMALRAISARSLMNSRKLRAGQITGQRDMMLENALPALKALPFDMFKAKRPFWEDVQGSIRRAHMEDPLSLVVVDYVQLMRLRDRRRGMSRVEELGEITMGCKMLAADLGVPVLALAQCSRAAANRDDKRPLISDLRESGSLENDADMVLLIHREYEHLRKMKPKPGKEDEHRADLDETRNQAEIILAKQRSGEAGEVVKVRYDGPTTRFYEDEAQPESEDLIGWGDEA